MLPTDQELAEMKVEANLFASATTSNTFEWQFVRDKKFAELIVMWTMVTYRFKE